MNNIKWKDLLNETLSKSMRENKDSVTYCFSTISINPSNQLPQSRLLVHRGFVNERRKNDDPSTNPIDANSTTTMLACTDIRSPKIDQIVDRKSPTQQGLPASICWWFLPTGEQYRIQTRAYIIPPPSWKSCFPTFPINQGLGPSTDFNWEEERLRIFEKLSPDLQASFLRPTPGKRIEKGSTKDWPQRLENHQMKTDALKNFALLVLDPVTVDLVRLKTNPHERFMWQKRSSSEWEEIELIP
ncbi:hypothetical protein O181_084552 [Austropuccinia psidii MF-1]|uniref:Pyridoxamine 5'-phosphate oxidase Alr4036 family FMN-binding domain-containing protein n=1 Tax=Austropuccinia psidii MF-1 TaxID=1389203 RepID=A0A9Q3FUG7_9BASI|nr:hypothetical protein [Austropuccinia psidii MF-1]